MSRRFPRILSLATALVVVASTCPSLGVSAAAGSAARASTTTAPKLVVAAYFPWYGTPTGPTGHWEHWQDGNGTVFVKDHPPVFYDSKDPNLINLQLAVANYYGIDAFAVSWWGSGSNEDQNFGLMLSTAAASNAPVKLAAQFETPGLSAGGAVGITHQLTYLLASYSGQPSYLHVSGRPVVFIYNPAAFTTDYSQWAAILATPAIAAYNAMFIVDSFTADAATVFDGLYTFAPFGPNYPYDPVALYNKYQTASAVAKAHNRIFAPAVAPGFDDSVIRTPSMVISRSSYQTYVGTWYVALASQADWVFIDSWNEWHEATELEPSAEYGVDYLYLTAVLGHYLKAASAATGAAAAKSLLRLGHH